MRAPLGPHRAAEVERAAILDLSDAARGDGHFHGGLAPRVHDAEVTLLLRRLAEEKGREAALLDALGGRLPCGDGLRTVRLDRPAERQG